MACERCRKRRKALHQAGRAVAAGDPGAAKAPLAYVLRSALEDMGLARRAAIERLAKARNAGHGRGR